MSFDFKPEYLSSFRFFVASPRQEYENVATGAFADILQKCMKYIESEHSIYIPSVFERSNVVYDVENGCPERGHEWGFTIWGTRHPKTNNKTITTWRHAVLLFADMVRIALKQEEVRVEFFETFSFLVKGSNSASGDFLENS